MHTTKRYCMKLDMSLQILKSILWGLSSLLFKLLSMQLQSLLAHKVLQRNFNCAFMSILRFGSSFRSNIKSTRFYACSSNNNLYYIFQLYLRAKSLDQHLCCLFISIEQNPMNTFFSLFLPLCPLLSKYCYTFTLVTYLQQTLKMQY